MQELIAVLVARGWVFKPATAGPAELAAFPAGMPSSVHRFCASFELFVSGDEVTWFLSHADYLSTSDSAFTWNEFENRDHVCAMDAAQRTQVDDFWSRYFPIGLCVRDDHSFLAIGIASDNSGEIFVGESSAEDEVRRVAGSLDELAQLLSGLGTVGKVPPALAQFFL